MSTRHLAIEGGGAHLKQRGVIERDQWTDVALRAHCFNVGCRGRNGCGDFTGGAAERRQRGALA